MAEYNNPHEFPSKGPILGKSHRHVSRYRILHQRTRHARQRTALDRMVLSRGICHPRIPHIHLWNIDASHQLLPAKCSMLRRQDFMDGTNLQY